ncbi:CotS family spore coat protein [Peribacillus sp. Hz7]|uniref:CotS family spore coat protein n=1 Tax=Peribacillus sp. Hz7 TaxID=3344873 RepID=UPI0035CA4121
MDEAMKNLDLGKRLMAVHYPSLEVFDIEVIQDEPIKTIWKAETSIGTVCLKRIRKSIPIVKFTTAAQDYLYAKGALVAGIIPTKENELFFVHEGYGLVLYQWIDGSDLEMEEVEEHAFAGLEGLAQFHKDTVGFVPPSDCQTSNRMGVWPHHYNKMLEEMKQWKIEAEKKTTPFEQAYVKLADEMIQLAEQANQMFQDSCYFEWVDEIGEYGYMCHQDYGKGNALQTEKGVYVLDLDNVTYDIPLRDVRKLIMKRMEEIGAWDVSELERLVNCYESILPLTEEQRKILYIDMLYPHQFYGCVKNPFKKGKEGEEKKILKNYRLEMEKLPALRQVLNLN